MSSNCCNAPMIENTDICSKCKEHAEELNGFERAVKENKKCPKCGRHYDIENKI